MAAKDPSPPSPNVRIYVLTDDGRPFTMALQTCSARREPLNLSGQMSIFGLGLCILLQKNQISILQILNQVMQEGEENQLLDKKESEEEDKPHTDTTDIIDPVLQLVENSNPIHLLAVIDHIDINNRSYNGVPLISFLCNKFLPLESALGSIHVELKPDPDGRTPLHYAVEADDAKAVDWCLRKGAQNVKDKFGNTPIMDAIRLGHRRSFLLCLHYQHYSEEIPQIAAQYNRVWELKVMKRLQILREDEKDQIKNALQVAVQNYNYEAVNYLSIIAPQIDMYKIRVLTDSKGIIRQVLNGRQERESLLNQKKSMITNFAPFATLLLGIMFVDIFEVNRFERFIHLWMLILIWFLMWLIGQWSSPAKKQPESIINILKQPYFPVMDDICPECFDFQKVTQDHCRKCGKCVQKYHFHTFLCVNESNEVLWYIVQFALMCFTYSLIKQIVDFHRFRTIRTAQEYNLIFLLLRLVETTLNRSLMEFFFYVFLFFLVIHQFFICLQLFGMAFMNRTYQQINRSEKYPYLYTPYRGKDGKIRTREHRIFYKYKLGGGLIVGLKNILLYFFA